MALPTTPTAGAEPSDTSQDEQHLRATSIGPEQRSPASASDSRPSGLLLFLVTHLERGRLDVGSFDMLYKVLRMISEISLFLFPHSQILEARVMRRIETLCRSIISTFHTIGEHIDAILGRARKAIYDLPELAVSHEKTRQKHLRIWRKRLRALHQPSRNDVNLYRYFLIYFDSQVHAPFLQLHRAEPEHNSWQLRHFFDHIRDCMISLQDNTEEANKIVNELDTEFTLGSWEAEGGLETAEEKQKISPLERVDEKPPKLPAPSESTDDASLNLDKFFDGVEPVRDDIDKPMYVRREYDIAPGGNGTGSSTPRVFAGSFDELEDSVKGLRLHRLDLTEGDVDTDKTVKVKDFAMPTPCLLPSPATLLERREALSVREPAWEHRMIGGKVMQSRRPHDRNRAQTVDERGSGLDAWLAESPSPGRAMERLGSVHSRVLHRQQTL